MVLAFGGLRCLFNVLLLAHRCCGSQLWIALTWHMQGCPGPLVQAPCRPFKRNCSILITPLYLKLQHIVCTIWHLPCAYFSRYLFMFLPYLTIIVHVLFWNCADLISYSSYCLMVLILLLLLSLINKVNSIHFFT